MILILDFGSPTTQRIARAIRELGFYSEVRPYDDYELTEEVKAVILSGSILPGLENKIPAVELEALPAHCPVLGIGYGARYLIARFGGEVERIDSGEYVAGKIRMTDPADKILDQITEPVKVWGPVSGKIKSLPRFFVSVADWVTEGPAIFRSVEGHFPHPVYGMIFHPEMPGTDYGTRFLENFLIHTAGVKADWTPARFVEDAVRMIRDQVGSEKVVLGLSGGVDSSVSAGLLHRAIGDHLVCIFVDNGLLRKNEFEQVLESYQEMGLQIKGVRAESEFYTALAGVSDPEEKRKTIGRVFIDVFEREAKNIPDAKWLAQGTIYPDVIESLSVQAPGVAIKSHHNVGGLPEKLHLKIIEPIRMLFKDEVRKVGAALGLPGNILDRHPFPGPGLGIRILGDITPEKVAILQEADDIYIGHLRRSGWYDRIWQAGAILLPVQSVGVSDDKRTYEWTVALRAVHSVDGMTAHWTEIPYDLLAVISDDIINNVKGINRVVYDISKKPPATIEWE